ncbi:hypothetical protein [Pontiella sp.]|uniref:hypothetical protein n=1 Tax=Pontiella sp. TaxID=2837462 RepID=UPI003565D545
MKHSELQQRLLDYTKLLGRQRIEIPELSGDDEDPFVIFSRPRTPEDMDKLGKYEDSARFNVEVIALLGENEDGTPALLKSDLVELMSGGANDLIKRIADQMFFHKPPKVADLKN